MTEEEEDRLNFHSKNTRAKDYYPIDSLYNLINGARSASSLELRILNLAERKELLSRKASASPPPKRFKASAKARHIQISQTEEEERRNMDDINEKLKKLRKMERDFHEEMDRREKEIKKRKQHRQQHKKNRQAHQLNLINVEEVKDSTPSPTRKQSSSPSQPSRKYSKEPEEPSPPHNLDFEDYYRQTPEVKINTAYQATQQVRNEIREMIKMQKMRQKQVQSIDEEDTGKAAASIVLERIDIMAQGLKKQALNESKNLYEVELARSQSENTFKQYDFGKEEVTVKEQPQVVEKHLEVQEYIYSPPQQVEEQYSPMNQMHFESHNEEYEDISDNRVQPLVDIEEKPTYWIAPPPVAKQVESMQNVDPLEMESKMMREEEKSEMKVVEIDVTESEKYSSEEEHQSDLPQIQKKTVTEQGSDLKEQIYDQVVSMTKKSEQFISKPTEQQQIYYSQTSPYPNILPHKQTQSIVTESLDFHPLEQPSQPQSAEKRLQNKKSSFKKLMAQNRANLVPRMAISTILNQKINEALGDIKNQQGQPSPSPPNLQQSIIKSEISSPSSKRKVNFKRRIVEQQHEKSYSRDSKPTFQRDPSRVSQNRKLLVSFFQDN